MKKYLFLAFFFLPISTHAFSDLPETHKHFPALTYLEYENVIGGYSDGTVRPDGDINRAELVKILVEGLGKKTKSSHKNCFPDVKEEWFAKYVCFALEEGWVAGYPNGTFKPAQNVNRAEALKIILNAFDQGPDESETFFDGMTGFNDVPVDAWYVGFLLKAQKKNFVEETGHHFLPGNNRTRGEVAEMVARIMQLNYMDDPVWTESIGGEFYTFLLINRLRAENGIAKKMVLKPELTKAARDHAEDMAENIGDMSHQGSDGSQSWDRIRRYYDYPGRAGENVGKGTVSQYRSVYKAISDVHRNIFMPEPHVCHNHRTTILSTCLNFTEVGVGVYIKDGLMYFSTDFTTPADSSVENHPELEVPIEYSGSNYDVTETDDYTFTTVNACQNDKVRLEYFIDSGAYLNGGNCSVYELSLNPDSGVGFNVMPAEVKSNMLVNLTYTSNIYGYTTIEFDEAYVSVSTLGDWEITSHSFPFDFNVGETVELSLKNSSNQQSVDLKLDLTEKGWVRILEI